MNPNAANPDVLSQTIYAWGLWDGFFSSEGPVGHRTGCGPMDEFDLSTLSKENTGIIHAVLSWFLYHIVTVGKTAMDIYYR